MFLQSAVDSPVLAWDWILRLFGAPLCRSLGRPFPTMIDPLDTAANYLDSDSVDDAETICGTILNAKPDESSARYLIARVANARKAHGRALDYLARVENPELAHLYVE
ncbi:MAG TPA: hypothetical protein VEK55_09860, partial [Xanthobacteraceae bacterium]|nr:hypothetical protein [Xanthobacteraceae bacterium]